MHFTIIGSIILFPSLSVVFGPEVLFPKECHINFLVSLSRFTRTSLARTYYAGTPDKQLDSGL